MSIRPAPSRRKSSNLLASLARQNTLSEREKEREREHWHESNNGDTGNLSGQQYTATPSTPSTIYYASSAATGGASSSTLAPPSVASSVVGSGSTAPTSHNTPSSSSTFGVNLENLRYIVQKRIQTFSYLKRAHEGRVHWFNTILLTRAELDAAFDNARMAKRTIRFAVLGMSISLLLEITAAHDFLRALLSLLSDFDAVEDDDTIKVKTKNLFKGGKGKRPSGAADYSGSLQDGDPSHVFSPNIPFDLDYFQTLYTLCDILGEMYHKILSFLGPSTGTSSMHTIGAFPQPLQTSPYRNGIEAGSFANIGDRRAGIGLSPMLVEVVFKIDSKFKKIIALVTKEVDQLARTALKDELDFINKSYLSGLQMEDGSF